MFSDHSIISEKIIFLHGIFLKDELGQKDHCEQHFIYSKLFWLNDCSVIFSITGYFSIHLEKNVLKILKG